MDDGSGQQQEGLESALQADGALKRLARRLVRDEASADDVVQDVWVAALQSPPGRIDNAPAWLRKVVRNVAAARARREQGRSRTEREWTESRPLASTEAPVERESIRRYLHRELERLQAPYGEALRLRFIEELSTREIARRLQAPENTVKTWIHRGLRLLRERLSREFGDDRSWRVSLIFAFDWNPEEVGEALGDRSPDSAGEAAGGGHTRWWAGGMAAMVLGAAVLWSTTRVENERVPASDDRVAEADSGEGSLEEVPPGVADRVSVARDSFAASAPEVPVDQGVQQPVDVVDSAGRPLPGAQVWVSVDDDDWVFELREVADDSGRAVVRLRGPDFRPHHLQPETERYARIQARAPGRVSSKVHHVASVRRGPLRLRTGPPGFTVRGQVHDGSGHPVAGARVKVGRTMDRIEVEPGYFVLRSPPSHVTGDDGRFEVTDAEAGPHVVSAFKPDWGRARVTVEGPAGAEVLCDIFLPRGGTITGRVVGEDGRPRAGVEVTLQSDEDPRFFPRTVSDDAGGFELLGGGLGASTLSARAPDGAAASTPMLLPPGHASVEFTLELRRSRGAFVRVEDEDGEPLAKVDVSFVSNLDAIPRSGPGGPGGEPVPLDYHFPSSWERRGLTDAEGRFGVLDAPDRPLRAYAHEGRDSSGILGAAFWDRPDGSERVIVRTSAGSAGSLSGMCRQADGTPWPDAKVTASHPELVIQMSARIDPTTGAFHFPAMPTGRWQLDLRREGPGVAFLTETEVLGGEVRDLGDLRTDPAGAVFLDWGMEADPGECTYTIACIVKRPGGDESTRAPDYSFAMEGTGPPPETLELLPGEYLVAVARKGWTLTRQRWLVRPDHETYVYLSEEGLSTAAFGFLTPDGCDDEELEVRLLELAGRSPELVRAEASLSRRIAVAEREARAVAAAVDVPRYASEPFYCDLEISPGAWAVVGQTPGGWRGLALFEYAASGPVPHIDVELQAPD